MQIAEKVKKLVDRYSEKLSEKDIKCSVSKKYFESNVGSKSSNSNNTILNSIDRNLDEYREKKYKNRKNCYHVVILRFSPTKENHIKETNCKEYAFLLRKIERPHTGIAPQKTTYQEEKILKKAEEQIQKILLKADTLPVDKICKDTWCDAIFRYTLHYKYGYKKTILGKDKFIWDMILLGVTASVTLAVILFTWILTNL